MTMDISDTLIPKSEQLDAVDLVQGPQVFRIDRVTKGNSEQPVNIHFVDFPRPWRPGKNMRRVLVFCWGKDASEYAGRSVELFCDPEVVYAGQAVGGVRIARMSHIDGQKKAPVIPTRGKGGNYTVDPLPAHAQVATAAKQSPTEAKIAELTAEWHTADDSRKAEIQVEVEALREVDALTNPGSDQ